MEGSIPVFKDSGNRIAGEACGGSAVQENVEVTIVVEIAPCNRSRSDGCEISVDIGEGPVAVVSVYPRYIHSVIVIDAPCQCDVQIPVVIIIAPCGGTDDHGWQSGIDVGKLQTVLSDSVVAVHTTEGFAIEEAGANHQEIQVTIVIVVTPCCLPGPHGRESGIDERERMIAVVSVEICYPMSEPITREQEIEVAVSINVCPSNRTFPTSGQAGIHFSECVIPVIAV